MKIYLSSPFEISRASDDWKKRIKYRLRMDYPEFSVLDPCPESCEEQELVDRLKAEKRWNELANLATTFVECDFAMIRQCQGVFAFLPYGAVTFGTTHEIIKALETHIPVVLVMPEGLEKVSAWLWGILGPQRIFTDVDEALDTLMHRILVANGRALHYG